MPRAVRVIHCLPSLYMHMGTGAFYQIYKNGLRACDSISWRRCSWDQRQVRPGRFPGWSEFCGEFQREVRNAFLAEGRSVREASSAGVIKPDVFLEWAWTICERVENNQTSREEKARRTCGGGLERLVGSWSCVCCWFSHLDARTRLAMSPSSGAGEKAPPPLGPSGWIHPAVS